MAGRKKSKGRKSTKKSSTRQSYAGLTRKQLIARLRSATKGKKTGSRRTKKPRQYGPKRPSKHYLAGVAAGRWQPKSQAEINEEADLYRYNDPGRRKGKKGKKGKKGTSAWTRFIKANSHKRQFRYKSGKLNLKAMAVAYRKTAAAKPSRKPKRASKRPKKAAKRSKKRSSRRDYGWY